VKSERYRELVEAAEHGAEAAPTKPTEVEDELSAEIKALFKNIRRALRDYPALRRKYFKRMVKLYPQLKSTARKSILPAVSPSSLSDYGSDSDQDGAIALSRVRTVHDYEGYSSTSDIGSDSESSMGSLDSDNEGPSSGGNGGGGGRAMPKPSVGAYYLLNRQEEDVDPRITKLSRPKGN